LSISVAAILSERFKLTSEERVDLFVGLNITETPDGCVKLSSMAYIESMAKKYLSKPLDEYPKNWTTPSPEDLRRHYQDALDRKERGEPVDPKLQAAYASLAGALIYEAPGVRIDENQTIAVLAITFPTDQLMLDAVRCLATRD